LSSIYKGFWVVQHVLNIAALFCGVCRVYATLATQMLIDCYGTNVIINSGTAGGMNTELEIFDTVIATESAYHDVNCDILTEYHPWHKSAYFASDERLLTLTRSAVSKLEHKYKVYFGRMVTGEAFITDNGRDDINEKYQPLSVDMETAGIAHVCYVNKIPFIAIRSITDTAKHSGNNRFKENCNTAAVISKDTTLALIEKLSFINS